MSHIKKFEKFTNDDGEKINEDDRYGVLNIRIDGDSRVKKLAVSAIRKSLNSIAGERHIFVDGEEVNPFDDVYPDVP